MPRRPPPILIRTLFLLPILLGLAGWLWSSTHWTGVAYGHEDRGVGVYLGTGRGTLQFNWIVADVLKRGWDLVNEPINPPVFWPSKTAWDDTSFLGFSYLHSDLPSVHIRIFFVPYWFPLVVFSGIFAWVWRKTRRKPDPKTAFPVEVAAAGGGRDRPSQTQTP